jgi:hypothetical protein
MVNEIGHSSEERFAEMTSTQMRLQESIETINMIVRKELKKLKIETPAGPASVPCSQHFPFSGDLLKGIIAFLTEKYKGNVIDKGILQILAGGTNDSNAEYQSRNVADLRDNSTYFMSINDD